MRAGTHIVEIGVVVVIDVELRCARVRPRGGEGDPSLRVAFHDYNGAVNSKYVS